MSAKTPDAARAKTDERRVRWIVRLGEPLLRLLALTWRFEVRNDRSWRAMRAEGRPFIFAIWHGQLLAFTWYLRDAGVTAMISEHRDGEMIARIVERWGFRTVRGSTSRGAARALLGMVRDLQSGREFAITPDGPRGPAGIPQPGLLLASQRAGAAIVTMRCDAARAWYLDSWDRFMVPKPFARVVITCGEPWLAPAVDAETSGEFARRMGPALPPGVEPGR